MKICGRDKLNITCCKTAGTFCNLSKEVEQGRMCYLSNETWVHISSQGNPDKYRRPLGNMLFNLHSRKIKVSCVLYDRCFERLIYRDLSQHIYYTQMKSLQHQHFYVEESYVFYYQNDIISHPSCNILSVRCTKQDTWRCYRVKHLLQSIALFFSSN